MNKKTAATKQMLQIIRLSSSSRTFRSTVAKEDENHSHFSTGHIQLQIFHRNCFGERRTWGIETTRNAKSMQKADLSTGRRCIDAEPKSDGVQAFCDNGERRKGRKEEESFYRLTRSLLTLLWFGI